MVTNNLYYCGKGGAYVSTCKYEYVKPGGCKGSLSMGLEETGRLEADISLAIPGRMVLSYWVDTCVLS